MRISSGKDRKPDNGLFRFFPATNGNNKALPEK